MVVKCLHCNKDFTKKHPSQKFCSNKGSQNCKDQYHNYANPSRLERIGIRKRDFDEDFDEDNDWFLMQAELCEHGDKE